jgi:hypothetical protein
MYESSFPQLRISLLLPPHIYRDVLARDELKNESLKRKWRFIAEKLIFPLLTIFELDI